MLVIRGRLTPELGAVVQRALEAASDRLFRESVADPRDDATAEVTPAQRRADALGLLAESALASDLDRGTAGDRYQVVVHVDEDTLTADAATGDGEAVASDVRQAVLEDMDGTHVSPETSRRMACDASTVVMRHASDGSVLDVGRKRRTIPPAIRRALAARHRHCQFPGCMARHCDVHHVQHWSDGGATRLTNLALLCRRHHRAVHEEGFTLTRAPDGTVHVCRPDGRPLPTVPRTPRWATAGGDVGDPLAPSTARLTAAGIRVGPHTATPDWFGDRLDLAYALDVLRDHPVAARSGGGVSAGGSVAMSLVEKGVPTRAAMAAGEVPRARTTATPTQLSPTSSSGSSRATLALLRPRTGADSQQEQRCSSSSAHVESRATTSVPVTRTAAPRAGPHAPLSQPANRRRQARLRSR